MKHIHTAAILLTSMITALAVGDDWPQWRGLDGTGVSSESAWVDEGQSDAAWSKNVGIGYTTFVVRDGKVITAGFSVDDEEDTVHCLDAQSGKKIWSFTYPCKRHDRMHKGGTLSTPTIDGEHVYVLNREGHLFCLRFDDGNVVWKKNLMREFDLEYPKWMFSASPLIIDDMMFLNVGRLIALNKSTGEAAWTTDSTGHAYSTPQPMMFRGKPHLTLFNSDGLALIDQATGRQKALHAWKTKYDINAATPIVIGDRIFISSGYNRGCVMLRVTDDGLETLWENKDMCNKMTGCVYVDGHLYGFDDSILKCIAMDGTEKWMQRGLGMGTLMAADGRLIIISSKGELIIAEATPDDYTERSRTKVLNGGVYWTMPVLANGFIYCRNSEGDIVCRDHRPSDG